MDYIQILQNVNTKYILNTKSMKFCKQKIAL